MGGTVHDFGREGEGGAALVAGGAAGTAAGAAGAAVAAVGWVVSAGLGGADAGAVREGAEGDGEA